MKTRANIKTHRQSNRARRLPIRPSIQREEHTCGVCAMTAVYRYYGLDPRKLNLRTLLGTDYALPEFVPFRERLEKFFPDRQGTWPTDLLAVLHQHGFGTKTRADGYDRYRQALRRSISAGHPALCLMMGFGHWTVVSGWDQDGVWISDSVLWEEHGRRTYHLTHEEFAGTENGVILLRRSARAKHRPMTNAAYLQEYMRGVGFGAGAVKRNIPRC